MIQLIMLLTVFLRIIIDETVIKYDFIINLPKN